MPEQIGFAHHIHERGQTRGAQRYSHHAVPPGATEAVVDDDSKCHAKMRVEPALQRETGAVGVRRQEQHALALLGVIDIGLVDPGIRHDEAQAMLDDHHVALAAKDLGRFGEDHLDETRILVTLARDLLGPRRGRHRLEAAIAPLGFRDDFLGDHQHVSVAGRVPRRLDRFDQDRREVVSGPDERNARECDQADPCCGHPRRLALERRLSPLSFAQVRFISVSGSTRTPAASNP